MSKSCIEIFNAKSPSGTAVTIEDVGPNDTVLAIKKKFAAKKHLGIERVDLRLDPRGKGLRDEEVVSNLNLPLTNAQLYYRDLGPQIAWKTVFLMEYAGPLCVYPLFYLRPWFVYGSSASDEPVSSVVTLALFCHSLHYAKRLYETQYVHRFSNGTMPIMNLFKNCTYYWGFAAFVSYFVNHPNYSTPTFGYTQVYLGLIGFLISELGNYSIHTLLRDLRPAGSKERKVPYPNLNPLTQLYNFAKNCKDSEFASRFSKANIIVVNKVEVHPAGDRTPLSDGLLRFNFASWTSFTLMTQCLPAAMFTLLGFVQMKIWANGKNRAYKRDFPYYPKNRTPIIPFIC